MVEHGAVEVEGPAPKQVKLAQAVQRGEENRSVNEITVALAIAFNPTMTFRMVDDHFFPFNFNLKILALKKLRSIGKIRGIFFLPELIKKRDGD